MLYKSNFSKTTILILVASIVAINAHAQLGIRAGINSSWITTFDDKAPDDIKSKTGYLVGMIFDVDMDDKSFIQIGLYLINQGGKSDKTFLGKTLQSNETVKMSLNYIRLNLVQRRLFGNSKVFWQVGPNFDFAISAKIIVNIDGERSKHKMELGKSLKMFNFGACGGIGYQFDNILIDLSTNSGIIKIFPIKHKYYNSELNFNVTYLF